MILNTPIAVSDAKQKVCCDVVKSCQSTVYFFALFLEVGPLKCFNNQKWFTKGWEPLAWCNLRKDESSYI